MVDLSDEQISELLRGSEERLKASKVESPSTEKSTLSLFSRQKSITPATAEFLKPSSYITSAAQAASIDSSLLVKPEERKLAIGVRRVEDPVLVKSSSKAKKPDAGSDWYNLPRTVLTPELKRDLQLLRMRDVLDSKRHYKKDNSKPKVPEFSQVGTIIEGPTEYFSSRLSNKDRKRTFIEEVLAGETSTQRFRTKYNEIQAAKTSGKKAHYKKMKELRLGGGSKG